MPHGLRIAVALLIGVPVLDALMKLSQIPAPLRTEHWRICLSGFDLGMNLLIVFAVRNRFNWMRWTFAVFATFELVLALSPAWNVARLPWPDFYGSVRWVIYATLMALLFVPSTNAYFRSRVTR